MTESIDESLVKINELLITYSKTIGIGTLLASNEVERYLNISSDELRKLTPSECGEASVLINRAATFIQIQYNKEKAVLTWCNDKLNRIIASEIDGVGTQYTPYTYRKELVIKNNDAALKLAQIIAGIKLRMDYMEFLPSQLNHHAKSFETLIYTKRNNT